MLTQQITALKPMSTKVVELHFSGFPENVQKTQKKTGVLAVIL